MKQFILTTIEVIVLGMLFAAVFSLFLATRAVNEAAMKHDMELAEPITFSEQAASQANEKVPQPTEFNSYQNPTVFFADARHYGPNFVGAYKRPPQVKGPVCVQRYPWRVRWYCFWRR